MNLELTELGNAGVELDVCAEAISTGAFMTARDALDRADVALQSVREQWRGLNQAERALLAKLAAPVSARRDQLAARIPKLTAVSEGSPEPDEGQDDELDAGEPASDSR